ncbi:adenine deaminase [Clostridium sp. UBA1056]|uniref:adenine deaminase n=1 Tax=unclassified Clostridium TaxID=2614128 RepID=UPI003217B556
MEILRKSRCATIENDKCDLVLKNGKFINVFTEEIEEGDIGIIDDTIIGIGSYDGVKEIDCSSKIICPGFIDGHIHVESSMVTPESYGNVALKNGVTTVVADPHEIANVLGTEGIEFMLDNSQKSLLDIYFMMPSCVPAVSFEENGAILSAEDLSKFIDKPEVIGLGEVMDVPSVINQVPSMINKLNAFKEKIIDGHAPEISYRNLNQYILSGIKTDHECSSKEEALEKIKLGMYVLIREGSAAKNLKDLILAVNDKNFRRFLFCTDDRHLEDLVEEGSINNAIRLSIQQGIDPIKACIMGSYNGYTCYGIKNKGAIAPGYKADLVILNDLVKVDICKVIKSGKEIDNNKKPSYTLKSKNTMNIEKVEEENFKIISNGSKVNVIGVNPGSLETKLLVKPSNAVDGYLDMNEYEDILKIGVFERHKNTNNYSLGYLSGLGIKNCAIAQSIAHDSHNIIVVGDNDGDMAKAVNKLIDIGGGITIVRDGMLIDSLSLEIGGLMTNLHIDYVYNKLKNLNSIVKSYGLTPDMDAFITLSFMSLPVIPEVKLTSKGLFSYDLFKFIKLSFD